VIARLVAHDLVLDDRYLVRMQIRPERLEAIERVPSARLTGKCED
jgi:hypothetical protein